MAQGFNLSHEVMEGVVSLWIKRLGLQRWNIEVKWDDPDHFKSDIDKAYIWRARDYEDARLYFNPNTSESWSMRTLHCTVVHELLHLVTRDVEFVLDQVEDQLHRDVETVVAETFKHHLEGAIDQIACRMVELVGIN